MLTSLSRAGGMQLRVALFPGTCTLGETVPSVRANPVLPATLSKPQLSNFCRARFFNAHSLRWLERGLAQCNHNHRRCCAIRPSSQARFVQLRH